MLNIKITGCVFDDQQLGWLYFFKNINDKALLYRLDQHVKRSCKRFHVPYNKNKIKLFSRAYYEVKNSLNSSYVPNFYSKRKKVSLNLDYELDSSEAIECNKASEAEVIQLSTEDIVFY